MALEDLRVEGRLDGGALQVQPRAPHRGPREVHPRLRRVELRLAQHQVAVTAGEILLEALELALGHALPPTLERQLGARLLELAQPLPQRRLVVGLLDAQQLGVLRDEASRHEPRVDDLDLPRDARAQHHLARRPHGAQRDDGRPERTRLDARELHQHRGLLARALALGARLAGEDPVDERPTCAGDGQADQRRLQPLLHVVASLAFVG